MSTTKVLAIIGVAVVLAVIASSTAAAFCGSANRTAAGPAVTIASLTGALETP